MYDHRRAAGRDCRGPVGWLPGKRGCNPLSATRLGNAGVRRWSCGDERYGKL